MDKGKKSNNRDDREIGKHVAIAVCCIRIGEAGISGEWPAVNKDYVVKPSERGFPIVLDFGPKYPA